MHMSSHTANGSEPNLCSELWSRIVYVDFLEHKSWEFTLLYQKEKKKLRTSVQLLSWFLVTQPQQRSSSVIIVEEIAQQPNLNFMKRNVVLLLNSVMENSIVERGYNIVFLEGPGRFCSLLTWSFFSLWVVSPYFAIRTRGANGTEGAESGSVRAQLVKRDEPGSFNKRIELFLPKPRFRV